MSATHPQPRNVSLGVAHFLAGSAALALLTWMAYRLHASVATVALLYLCLVVLVSLWGSLVPALVIAIGGTVCLAYFFARPLSSFAAAGTLDIVALVAFSLTAAVITSLMTAQRRSEYRWRNAFENNPTMYFMLDPDGTVVSVNPFGAEQLGYTVGELVGQSVLKVFHEADRAAAQEHVAGCLAHAGQSMSWELRKIRRDGTILWVRETARAVRGEHDRAIVLVACEDVTLRREAQDELRHREVQLREKASLLELTHDTIFVRDLNDVITYWNRGAEELYGWTRDEAIGRVSHDLMRTAFPDTLERITATLLRTRRWEGEIVHTKRDGSQVIVASRWSVQRGEDGQSIGTLETNNDITEHRRAETALRSAQTELARVTNLTTMSELAASIAHELRQPLAAIVMNGSAALRWLDREQPELEEARDAASRTVREAQRAEEVIRGLRSLVGGSGLQRRTLDLNDAVQEVVELVRGEIQRQEVSVRTDLFRDLPPAFGDRVQLQQVLLNLIMNGMEAMTTVTEHPKALVIRTEPAVPSGVAVAVEDAGPGLDPAIADRIFDPFFTTKPSGLGMGLSICRTIIDAHGGQLRASPRSPYGTSVRFTVPTVGV